MSAGAQVDYDALAEQVRRKKQGTVDYDALAKQVRSRRVNLGAPSTFPQPEPFETKPAPSVLDPTPIKPIIGSRDNPLTRGLISPETIDLAISQTLGLPPPVVQELMIEGDVAQGTSPTKAGVRRLLRGSQQSVAGLASGATSPAGIAALATAPISAPVAAVASLPFTVESAKQLGEGIGTAIDEPSRIQRPEVAEQVLGGAAGTYGGALAIPTAARGLATAGKSVARVAEPILSPRTTLQRVMGVERPKGDIQVLESITKGLRRQAVEGPIKQLKEPVAQAFKELDEFVDSNTRPVTAGEIFDDVAGAYEAKNLVVPNEIKVGVEKAVAKKADLTNSIPFSRLRQLRSEISSFAKSAEGPQQAALFDLADRIEARAQGLADTAGVLENYSTVKSGWRQYLDDIESLEALTEAPHIDAAVKALRDPKVVDALRRHGIRTGAFTEAEFAQLTEPKIPGFNLRQQQAAAQQLPEGGPRGMRALALERATIAEPVREAGELFYPAGRARLAARTLGRMRPVREFVAGPEEPFAPPPPAQPFVAPPLPPATMTIPPPRPVIPPPRAPMAAPTQAPPTQAAQLGAQSLAPPPPPPPAPVLTSGQAFRVAELQKAIKSLEGQKPPSRSLLKRELGDNWESIPAKELRDRLQGKLDEIKQGSPPPAPLQPPTESPRAKVAEAPKPTQAELRQTLSVESAELKRRLAERPEAPKRERAMAEQRLKENVEMATEPKPLSKVPGTSQHQDAQIASKQRGMIQFGRRQDALAQELYGKPYRKLNDAEKGDVNVRMKAAARTTLTNPKSGQKLEVVDKPDGGTTVKPLQAPSEFKKGDKVSYVDATGKRGKGEVMRVFESKGKQVVEVYDEGSRFIPLEKVSKK